MNRNRKRCCWALAILVLSLLLLAVPVFAVGMSTLYHPPAVTVLTENAPRDLKLTIRISTENGIVPVELEKKTRVWEQQFRLFREGVFSIRAWYGNNRDLKDAELVLRSGGQEKTVPLTREITDQMNYNDILMLDYKNGTVSVGMPFWRGPLMLILRTVIAAALVLLIFRLRGYEGKRAVILVPIVALVCYGLLNMTTSSWLNTDPRSLVSYILYAMLAIFVQILGCVVLVDEDSADRRLTTCLLANLPAMAFNSLALFLLPQ